MRVDLSQQIMATPAYVQVYVKWNLFFLNREEQSKKMTELSQIAAELLHLEVLDATALRPEEETIIQGL